MKSLVFLLRKKLKDRPTTLHSAVYQALYELRAKSKNLVRIVFTLMDNGDVLLLIPFIKRHKRNTMQALDRSLDCLAQIRDGSCSVTELSIKFFINGGKMA